MPQRKGLPLELWVHVAGFSTVSDQHYLSQTTSSLASELGQLYLAPLYTLIGLPDRLPLVWAWITDSAPTWRDPTLWRQWHIHRVDHPNDWFGSDPLPRSLLSQLLQFGSTRPLVPKQCEQFRDRLDRAVQWFWEIPRPYAGDLPKSKAEDFADYKAVVFIQQVLPGGHNARLVAVVNLEKSWWLTNGVIFDFDDLVAAIAGEDAKLSPIWGRNILNELEFGVSSSTKK
jgi:hypothetical protein